MTDINDKVFGQQNRRPAWTRIMDIVLRTLHVMVISVLFGGAVFKIQADLLGLWPYLAIASGAALIVSEVFHSRHWPYQGRGVMVVIHAALFGVVFSRPDLALPCLSAALIIGMAGSHMPKRLRHWSFIHKQVKD